MHFNKLYLHEHHALAWQTTKPEWKYLSRVNICSKCHYYSYAKCHVQCRVWQIFVQTFPWDEGKGGEWEHETDTKINIQHHNCHKNESLSSALSRIKVLLLHSKLIFLSCFYHSAKLLKLNKKHINWIKIAQMPNVLHFAKAPHLSEISIKWEMEMSWWTLCSLVECLKTFMDASKCLLFADDKNNFSFQLIFYLLSSFIIASIKQKKNTFCERLTHVVSSGRLDVTTTTDCRLFLCN